MSRVNGRGSRGEGVEEVEGVCEISLEQLTCQRCTLNSVDDKIHFLITCSYFATQ